MVTRDMRSTSDIFDNAISLRRDLVTDKKSLAIILGTAIGVAAVAAAVGVYVHHNNENEPAVHDINDVFEQARNTVRKLDEALEILKKPAI